ncbi:preprotein translocase subunit YajC [Candidatus Desantisbacteria bacterium]|nr:preprotein translocase subunit YajC [Candidatus Desantisbacteria bacterium]
MGQTQSAQSPATPASIFIQMAPLVLIFGVFYFLIIRPQQQKHKKHQEILNNLKKGDKVVTIGGLTGVVNAIKDDNLISIEISSGVKVDILKSAVSSLLGSNTEEK